MYPEKGKKNKEKKRLFTIIIRMTNVYYYLDTIYSDLKNSDKFLNSGKNCINFISLEGVIFSFYEKKKSFLNRIENYCSDRWRTRIKKCYEENKIMISLQIIGKVHSKNH